MDILTTPGARALRSGRRSAAGRHYLVTTVCHARERRSAHARHAVPVAAAIGSVRLWRDSRMLCWVLMPDHLHALIELGQSESLAVLMKRVKCVTAGIANTVGGRYGSVWMSGYHDRALRSDENLLAAARYVVANPMRAGLVKCVADYPYWGCAWSVDDIDDPIG
ncbi:REP-associated tyrosine transposase [Lysobacter hankyongensis]